MVQFIITIDDVVGYARIDDEFCSLNIVCYTWEIFW